jgi:hypothetical protein
MSGTSVRIVDMPNLGAVTDSSLVVGEHAGSGLFSAPAMSTYLGTKAAYTTVPTMNGTGTAGTATLFSRGDHVHPTDTSRVGFTDLTKLGTADTSGSWDLFGNGVIRAGSTGVQNCIIGQAINNSPANTLSYPCGVTAYGKIIAGSSGNTAYGIFGRADTYDTGTVTHELNTFNYKGAPTPTLPPNRAIGTTSVVPVCLTVAAGGSYSSSIGVQICQEGSTFQKFITGLYVNPDACTSYGLYVDSTSTTGPSQSLYVRAQPTGVPATFQTLGTAVPANAMISCVDNSNAAKFQVRQNGDATGASVYPLVDNVAFCGTGTLRWSAVYATNGTIQTSDPQLKSDMRKLADYPINALDIVRAVDPITFRWTVGGYTMAPVSEEREVQATETRHRNSTRIELRQGVPVQVPCVETTEVALFDEVPVTDERGEPVQVPRMVRPAQYSDAGATLIEPAVYDGTAPLTHHVPRMVRKAVMVDKPLPRTGKRVHWGFSAPEVKAAFDAVGLDFGGYVKTEDGTEALRPDQLIPVLWRAVQELSAEMATLKAGRPA